MVKLTKNNYVERDISWMHFNHRILEEAQREDRADVIVPAAQLFLMVADVTKAETIMVPTIGLADGVINELASLI